MDIEEFKKKYKIKKRRESSLNKYKDDILKLHYEKMTLETIQLFLSENGVVTSFQNIAKFIDKQKLNKDDSSHKIPSKKSTEEQKEVKKSTEEQKGIFKVDLKKKYGPDSEIKHIEI